MSRLARFTLVGAAGTAMHFAVLWLLVRLQVGVVVATTAGAIAGALVNYALNRRYTFQSHAAHRVTAPRYYLLVLGLWGLNAGLMGLLVDGGRWHYLAAQGVATATCFVVHFVGSRNWVFREQGHG
ncbi:GtrA family protein [Chitiniphilus purpureus]|uniref:GtrA family protein n=1 Tax=Chitiniphilus purpureus TaxID=2981137 RepID=A0ABY6DMX9_9NEIS|nr:GtrA family protein [Chitiniphilus sp. CD1]UXY15704.1 GtrA family protein [Chitiniphilus sp. CD1]